MDDMFKPLLSGTTPSPPKVNVSVTWSALAPMDEKNQTPNITFANTRAETLRFGGAGVQHSACCRVWIFCPSTVVLLQLQLQLYNYNYNNYNYIYNYNSNNNNIINNNNCYHKRQNITLRPELLPKHTTPTTFCHPCITTTHLSYSFLFFKVLPRPCAALLVANQHMRIQWEYILRCH